MVSWCQKCFPRMLEYVDFFLIWNDLLSHIFTTEFKKIVWIIFRFILYDANIVNCFLSDWKPHRIFWSYTLYNWEKCDHEYQINFVLYILRNKTCYYTFSSFIFLKSATHALFLSQPHGVCSFIFLIGLVFFDTFFCISHLITILVGSSGIVS